MDVIAFGQLQAYERGSCGNCAGALSKPSVEDLGDTDDGQPRAKVTCTICGQYSILILPATFREMEPGGSLPVIMSGKVLRPPDSESRHLVGERLSKCSFCGRATEAVGVLHHGRVASICSRCVGEFRANRTDRTRMGKPEYITEGKCSMIGCGRAGPGWAFMGGRAFLCEVCRTRQAERAARRPPEEIAEAEAAYRDSIARQECAFCERKGDQISWLMGGTSPPISICGDCVETAYPSRPGEPPRKGGGLA